MTHFTPSNDISGLTLGLIDIQGGGYTITGNAITLEGELDNDAGNNQYSLPTNLSALDSVDVTAGRLEITSPITGSGGLLIGGSSGGKLLLDQTNTYTGETTLDTILLAVASDNALGTGTLALTGGTLQNNSSTALDLDNPLTIDGNATINLGGGLQFISTSGGTQPGVTVDQAATLTLVGSSTLVFNGELTSQMVGAALATLTVSSTFTGTSASTNDGRVVVAENGENSGVVSVQGDTDLLLGCQMTSTGSIFASGNNAEVEMGAQGLDGDDSEQAPVTGAGSVEVSNGATMVAPIANPDFTGTVTVFGGTIKIETADDNALGKGAGPQRWPLAERGRRQRLRAEQPADHPGRYDHQRRHRAGVYGRGHRPVQRHAHNRRPRPVRHSADRGGQHDSGSDALRGGQVVRER